MLRYLTSFPSCVTVYIFQNFNPSLVLQTDSDWAGDAVSRKSTSGGVILRGSHLLAHWGKTQQVIALSSAEAPLNACVRGVSECIGRTRVVKGMWSSLLRHASGRRERGQGDGVAKRLRQGQALVDPTILGPRCCGFPGYSGAENTSGGQWGRLAYAFLQQGVGGARGPTRSREATCPPKVCWPTGGVSTCPSFALAFCSVHQQWKSEHSPSFIRRCLAQVISPLWCLRNILAVQSRSLSLCLRICVDV